MIIERSFPRPHLLGRVKCHNFLFLVMELRLVLASSHKHNQYNNTGNIIECVGKVLSSHKIQETRAYPQVTISLSID